MGAFVGGSTAIAYGLLRSDVFQEGTAIVALPLVTGFILAAAFVWIGIKTGVTRFFRSAMISALAGTALSLAGFPETAALGAYWGILGASHCVSGASVLLKYLHRHPASGADPS
jgi:hypothetical protein